jgi:hypothetical protein
MAKEKIPSAFFSLPKLLSRNFHCVWRANKIANDRHIQMKLLPLREYQPTNRASYIIRIYMRGVRATHIKTKRRTMTPKRRRCTHIYTHNIRIHTRASAKCAPSAARLNEKSMRIRNICQVAAHADAEGRARVCVSVEFHGHIWRTIILRRNSERDQCSSRRCGVAEAAAAAAKRGSRRARRPPLASLQNPNTINTRQPTNQATHPPTFPTILKRTYIYV